MPPSESGLVIPPSGCPAHAEGAAASRSGGTLDAGGHPLYGPEFTADPAATYKRLHEHGPVAPVELTPGVRAWLVVDYAAALEVLRAPETFSTDARRWRALIAGEVPPDSPVLPLLRWQPLALYIDGDAHRRLRQVTTDSLATIDSSTLRECVERHADRLIDEFAAEGEADLVGQYAWTLPARVLGELCGASAELSEQLLDATFRMANGMDVKAALAEMATCAEELASLKRERPGPDVTSWMLAHPAGLDGDEIIGVLLQFMAYGGGTLRLLISSGLRLMLSDDWFAGDLSGGSLQIDDALDEVLWHDPPVANHAPHFPVRDVDLAGVRVREGEPVLISFAAASTGPSAGGDSRAGNRAHLAWGAGPHACPAQSQARLIATVAMERLLDRLPEVELAVPIDELRWRSGPFSRIPLALPVRFPPVPLSEQVAGSAAAREDDRPGPVPAFEATTADAGAATSAATGAAMSSATREAPAQGQYVWHPAADDRRLAGACIDVRAGRYLSAHEVLKETRGDFDLRAHRSLILASEAADSDLVERWLAEEPSSPEAALLWARVAVIRALRAADANDQRALALGRIAMAACKRAAQVAPEDPTPWVARLTLARVQRTRDAAPKGLLTAPPGPWPLFAHVLRLDPWNREAHHRFLAFFFTRYGGSANHAWDVAAFLSQRAPSSSALRLLPLVALVEDYNPAAPLADRTWEQPQWTARALEAFEEWFPHVADYRFTPVVDLAYLAHALIMARRRPEAREVLVAMGRYASRMPWSVFGNPEEQLTRARRICGLPVPRAA